MMMPNPINQTYWQMSDFNNLSINDSEGRPTTPTNATPSKEGEQKKPVKTPNSLKIEKEGSADIKKGMFGFAIIPVYTL